MKSRDVAKVLGNGAQRLIWLQIGVSLGVALLSWLLAGRNDAVAALLGGACAYVPALAYQLRARMARNTDVRGLLRAEFAGEGFKFAVSMVMFALVFSRNPAVNAPLFFAVFCAAQLCYFVALLIDKN